MKSEIFTLCSPRLSEGYLLMKYALKRAAAGLATILIVSFLTFAAFSLISGDTATAMLGTSATPERLAALRAELGLDRPLLVRYGEWLLGFFTGDLGVSTSYKQPVWEILGAKFRLTLCLSLMSFVLITAVSIPLGLWSAGRRRFEGARTALNQLGIAGPSFFTGILLSWVFGVGLKWFMPGQFPDGKEDFAGAAVYLLFAAIALLANALGWLSHRQWHRSLLGMIRPAIVFAATVWLLGNWWTANLMYVGLALMVGVSIWDFVSPAHRRCGPDGCELPPQHG